MSQMETLKEDGEQYDTKFAKYNSIFQRHNITDFSYLKKKNIQLMWYKMLIKTMKKNKYVSSEM